MARKPVRALVFDYQEGVNPLEYCIAPFEIACNALVERVSTLRGGGVNVLWLEGCNYKLSNSCHPELRLASGGGDVSNVGWGFYPNKSNRVHFNPPKPATRRCA